MDYKKLLPKAPPECCDAELFQLLSEFYFVSWHPDCEPHRPAIRKRLADPSVLARAEAAISDPYERLRVYAGQLLMWERREEATPFIHRLLHDDNEFVRGEIAGSLALFRCDACVQKLIELATADRSAFVRGKAATGLGGQDALRAIPVLIEILDRDHEVSANGISPSCCAATALDEMMETEWTQKRHEGTLRSLNPDGTDLTALREQALLYLVHVRQTRHA